MKKEQIIKILVIVMGIFTCLFYLFSKATYTAYETNTNGRINPDIANWNVKVNGFTVTSDEEQVIGLTDITWTTTNALPTKAVPGSTGVATITIDPDDTEVEVKYTLEIIDSDTDPTKFLHVTGISDQDNQLVRVGSKTYSGIITLSDISNHDTKIIYLNVEWPVTGEVDPTSEDVNTSSNYLVINFTAEQYKGEALVPYTE